MVKKRETCPMPDQGIPDPCPSSPSNTSAQRMAPLIPGYIGDAAMPRVLPPGTSVFRHEMACEYYLWVAKGSVRVSLLTAAGNELLLYRVNPGESCMLTTTCLMASTPYPAQGVTETTVHAVLLPKHAFEATLMSSPDFRQQVFSQLGSRLAQIIARIESVKFHDIDARLAYALLQHADERQRVCKTHQELAAEIGTTREVTSRHLKALEKKQVLTLGRGCITLRRPTELQEACTDQPIP
ncbi:MAG: Crp/Fnr family transcriptional regulator [Thiotrichales bacterium]